MSERQEHLKEVRSYLQAHFSAYDLAFSQPHGHGKETYFAHGNGHSYFVKIGATIERYMALAEIGLTPPVLSAGQLKSGISILVQPFIAGKTPSRLDFQNQFERVAALIRILHNSPRVRRVLPPACSDLHKGAGREAFSHLLQKWERYKLKVPNASKFVDISLAELALEIEQFTSEGLVASHNDICNANWLFANDGKTYLIDLDSMSMEDPALDMGAFLWWYYPPEMRGRFLEIAGYPYNDEFRHRMRVRMALHCLSILLPREQSFDDFQLEFFSDSLRDFRAVLANKENPEGYSA